MSILYKTGLLLVFVVPTVVQACEPDCSNASAGDFVPDPMSCSNYYICINTDEPTDAPVPCPDGEEFDVATSICVPIPGTGSTCTPICMVPDCHMTCSSANAAEYIRNPLVCGEYYLCSYGSVVSTLTCTDPEPYFDGEKCVSDESVCCSDLCTPYCQPGVVQAPDPVDCNRYYICLDEGLALEDYHNTCPENSYFDIPTGHCLEGASCVTLCSADGGRGLARRLLSARQLSVWQMSATTIGRHDN